MENLGKLPEPEESLLEGESELFPDAFGIKELQTMVEQEKVDVQDVLEIVKQGLEEVAPDPSDAEAAEEYKLKMRLLNELAQRQLGRSAVLRGVQEQIDQKLAIYDI
jgi:hypothetical protein